MTADIVQRISEWVQRVFQAHRGKTEKDWQLALEEELKLCGGEIAREVHLGTHLAKGQHSTEDVRVFGQGRAVDFVIDRIPVELKILKNGLPDWGMASLLQQGLIWRAASDKCLLIAVSGDVISLSGAELDFLDWLETRGIETVVIGERDYRARTARPTRVWEPPKGLDDESRQLANELEKRVLNLGENPSWKKLRDAVTAHLRDQRWTPDPRRAGDVLFVPDSVKRSIFRRGDTWISVQTVVVQPNDAGAADGKLQAGMALSGIVNGTIVIAFDRKDRKHGRDVETAGAGDPFVGALSDFCRDLGIDWRLVHPGQDTIRWPVR